jgi:Xaa-Pro aminopeptidase
MRQRDAVIRRNLEQRLETILPRAMRENGFDMWLILCQEDDYDPVFSTMMPMNTWCPILQMLIFTDRGPTEGIERINLSMTRTRGLYDRPWHGSRHEEQWPLLREIIADRDPRRIGINTGAIQWAAGGLTHNLYTQLVETLPAKYVDRLASAETMAVRWLATLTDDEVALYEHVVSVAHSLIAACYGRETLIPGVTTTEDLEWAYWQRCASAGLQISFKPFFNIVRSEAMKAKLGHDDPVIRPGDLIHCDVGMRYLRLVSDHQEWAYVLRAGETAPPAGVQRLMTEANRLQDIFMAEFRRGLSGNELLTNILTRARREGIPKPKVYSHSLGLFLHEPGPLIGLPWEQERCEGRGDVRLELNSAFTMELGVRAPVPEWGDQEVQFGIEEDVVFTRDGCYPIDGRQTAFYLI